MRINNKFYNNVAMGSLLENEVVNIFKAFNIWSFVFPRDNAGQPFDVLGLCAIRSNCLTGVGAYAIECKFCSQDKLMLDRIRPNQIDSMTTLIGCVANPYVCYVAVKFASDIETDKNVVFADVIREIDDATECYFCKGIYLLPFQYVLDCIVAGRKSISKKEVVKQSDDFFTHLCAKYAFYQTKATNSEIERKKHLFYSRKPHA